MKRFALIATVALFSVTAAHAEDCTEEKAEALSQKLFAMLQKDPSLSEKLEGYVAEVEKEYGGEPSEAQACEAIGKLITKVEAGG